MRARAWLLTLLLASCVGACGKHSPEEPEGWFTRVVPPETIVAGVRVLLEVDDLGLTPQDVGEALAEAKRANPGAGIACLVATRTHPLELPLIIVRYAPHDVSERVRWFRQLFVARGGQAGVLI